MSPIVEADRSMSPPPQTPPSKWALVIEKLDVVIQQGKRQAEELADVKGKFRDMGQRVDSLNQKQTEIGLALERGHERFGKLADHITTGSYQVDRVRPRKNGLTGARILIVEDEESQRASLARLLYDLNAESVVTCGAVAEAEEALIRGRFDLALIDLGLPDNRGTILLATIHGRYPATRTIVISGRYDAGDEGILQTLKPRRIEKPVDVDLLVTTVREEFARARAGAR